MPASRGSSRLSITALACAVAATASCHDATGPASSARVRVDPSWVSGEAAAALDEATGQFRLAYPPPKYVGLASAETIAVAVARLLGAANQVGNSTEVLQRDRGGPIDFNRLRICERAVYSVSPFGDFPDAAPVPVRRAWSSHWALALCGVDGAAELSVGVSDGPPDPDGVGTGIALAGVPYRYPSGLPLTPEQAVEALVRAAKGRVVVSAPVAYNQWDDRGVGELPLCASWRLTLDAPVPIENVTTGAKRAAQQFFVRHVPACFVDEIAFFVAAESQPTSRWVFYWRTGAGGSVSELDSLQVPLVGPAVFERVRIDHP